jgi:tetratricopeptide (TPR) repeat protein
LLNEKHDVNALNQFYAQFKKQIKVESIQTECAFHYALFKADYYGKLGELDSSYFFSRKAIELNPDDLDATNQFISALFKSIDLKRFENGSDSAVFYYRAYENLRSNKLYCSAYAAVMLQSAYKDINAKNYKKARKTLDEFDAFGHASPGLLFDPDQVGLVYSKIALREYNFNKSKALKTIRSGLELAPGHYDLLKVQSFMR